MSTKIAIITARGGSKRIKNKNIRNFCGKPIIYYPIKAAINSNLFDEIMVSTDSKEIAEIAIKYGAKVPFYRSAQNSDDFATTIDVIIEVLNQYKDLRINFDFGCCIYPTAAFVDSNNLIDAYNQFNTSNSESLISVTKYSTPIQRALTKNNNNIEFAWPENINKRSQDLKEMYFDSAQFYFFRPEIVLSQKKLITQKCSAFEFDENSCHDIDNESDWHIAELKYQNLEKNVQ